MMHKDHNFIEQHRYHIQLMLSGILSLTMSYLAHLDLFSALVIVTYAMMLVQTNIGATISALGSALLWIAVGLLLGLSCLLMFSALITIHPDLIWIVMAGLIVVTSFAIPLNRYARTGTLTAILVLIFGQTSDQPFLSALERGSYLMASVLIGLLVVLFILPKRAKTVIHESIEEFTDHSLALFQHITAAYFAPDAEKKAFKKMSTFKKTIQLRELIIDFSALSDDAKWERMSHHKEYFQYVMMGKNRTISFLTEYTRIINDTINNPLFTLTKTHLQDLTQAIETLLVRWCHLAEEESDQTTPPKLKPIFQSIEDLLKKNRDFIKTLPMEDLTNFFALYHLLKQYAERLVELSKTLSRRSQVLKRQ